MKIGKCQIKNEKQEGLEKRFDEDEKLRRDCKINFVNPPHMSKSLSIFCYNFTEKYTKCQVQPKNIPKRSAKMHHFTPHYLEPTSTL